ncbi:HAD family hydrolase [Pontibacter lucknowensis]|uniref:Haloacid Dehalogenase superfamily, subfamily IB, phosphoserine phosphatase-like n=1 Tax=Pontibacter lucknowensis TaxID=1077936 RepID=A0A1N6T8M7_9BACT|nr:HAD family hydrolase [Pontibacter lucknowensis]SIQ49745.1 Haloacid Dehalogenase superfamily, subfamily IB, phosphoserine phosphatase-like [Pontibacter lucknowensis]
MTEKQQNEIKVVVFDLNGTFYNKSSKEEFFKFISKKKPHKLAYYFQMIYYKVLLKLHQIRMTEFKENFFNYLDNIPPKQVEQYAREFWQQEFPDEFNEEIKAKLDRYKKEGIQVICATGALEVYVKPLFELYPVDLFFGTQTRYNGETYIVEGKACKDEEKIKRLDKHFNGKPYRIVEAYSDNKENILDEADRAWLVKDDGKLVRL